MSRIKYTKDRKEWPLTSKYGYTYYHIFGIDDSGPYGTVKGYYFDDYMYSDKSDLTYSKITEFVNKYSDVDRVLIRVYTYNALMDGPGASEESIYWRGKASEFRNSNSKKEAVEENDKMIKEDFKQSVGEDLYKYVSENYYKMEREELKTIAVEAIYQLYDRIPERDYKDAIELILEVYSDTYGEEFEGDIAEKLTNEYMGMTREELRLFAVEALYQLSSYLSEEEYKEAHDDIYDIYSEYFGNDIVEESTRVENSINRLTEREVLQLRSEIVLDSSYTNDYSNTLGINETDAYNFFDGYVSYLVELSEEENISDDDIIDKLDNEENLLSWWYMQMSEEDGEHVQPGESDDDFYGESAKDVMKQEKSGKEVLQILKDLGYEASCYDMDCSTINMIFSYENSDIAFDLDSDDVYDMSSGESFGDVKSFIDRLSRNNHRLYSLEDLIYLFNLKKSNKDIKEESTKIEERNWKGSEPLGTKLRDFIEQEDYENILKTIYEIAMKYSEKLGEDDYSGAFEELATLVEGEWDLVNDPEMLSEFGFDDVEDLVDTRLEELYDACDNNGIWINIM